MKLLFHKIPGARFSWRVEHPAFFQFTYTPFVWLRTWLEALR